MRYVGVDACRGGWFWVGLEDRRRWAVGVAQDAGELWRSHRGVERMLIDVPVGLREEGEEERACDRLARDLLGADRASSVFPAPCRPAAYEDDPGEASRINEERTGRGLSAQSRALLPRIREVDHLLQETSAARDVIREMHPEVAFWGLNAGVTVPSSKKDPDGQVERIAILDAHDPRAPRVAAAALCRYRRNRVARDDVLDALSGAVTAAKIGELRSLPPQPEVDPTGLPMEMVFWAPRNAEVPGAPGR